MGGHPPASVNMHWRRFRTKSIPVDDPTAFDKWLRDRWAEKDKLLGIYYRTGRFPADRKAHRLADGKICRGAGYIESQVKSVRWYEFLQIFAPVGLFAMVLYMFYGATPKQEAPSADKQVWINTMNTLQKALTEKPRKTASSLPKEPSSKAKAVTSTSATRKTSSQTGISGPNIGKVKNEKPAPKALTVRAKPVQPMSQGTKSGGPESSKSINKKAISKNQPTKSSGGSHPSKELIKKVTKVSPIVPRLESQPQSTQKHLESPPRVKSIPKKLGSQNMKPKGTMKSAGKAAVTRTLPGKLKSV